MLFYVVTRKKLKSRRGNRYRFVQKGETFPTINLYALEHVHVVQICTMHINAMKTQLMHKNVQINPENSQNFTQHSCCSMLTQ